MFAFQIGPAKDRIVLHANRKLDELLSPTTSILYGHPTTSFSRSQVRSEASRSKMAFPMQDCVVMLVSLLRRSNLVVSNAERI
jgi:hypothetical protein